MYQVLSKYSFEDIIEHLNKSQCRLTRPKFETFWNPDKRQYATLQPKIRRNKIILKRPRAGRRGFQWNFVIHVTEQASGTLLKGRFVIPNYELIAGILCTSIWLAIHVLGFSNLDRAMPTHAMTDFGKILVLTFTCCWGLSILSFFLFGGRLIYRQGEKEVLAYFRTLGTEIKTDNPSRMKRSK